MAKSRTKPDLKQLCKYLKRVTEWENLAVHLPKIEEHHINTIKRDNKGTERQKMALASKWLKTCPSACYDHVVSALHKIEENTIAEWIVKEHCTNSEMVLGLSSNARPDPSSTTLAYATPGQQQIDEQTTSKGELIIPNQKEQPREPRTQVPLSNLQPSLTCPPEAVSDATIHTHWMQETNYIYNCPVHQQIEEMEKLVWQMSNKLYDVKERYTFEIIYSTREHRRQSAISIARKDDEIQSLRAKANQLLEVTAFLEMKSALSKQENDKLKMKYQKLEQELQYTYEEHVRVYQELEQEFQYFYEEYEGMLSSREEKIKKLTQANEDLKKQLEEDRKTTERMMDEFRDAVQEQEAKMKSTIEQLEKEKKRLEETLAKESQNGAQLKEQCEQLTTENATLHDTIETDKLRVQTKMDITDEKYMYEALLKKIEY